MAKKTKAVIVLLVLVIIVLIIVFNYLLKPITLSQELEFWNISPNQNVEYISENMSFDNKPCFVYAALSEGTGPDGKDQYIIATGNIKGIRNNKYNVVSYWEQEDELLTSSKYLNIYDFPERTIEDGKNYIGSIYVGTVPITCTSVTIRGKQATMVEQSFDLNGEKVHFYLYYCAVEESGYTDGANVIVTDKDGGTYSVSTVDGGEYPILTKVNTVS